jgi:hypothetical protein
MKLVRLDYNRPNAGLRDYITNISDSYNSGIFVQEFKE